MNTKVGDIIERLPSRIVQVVSYHEHGGVGYPAAVLCADGSCWHTAPESGWRWRCSHPPHAPEPATDWQARAAEGCGGVKHDWRQLCADLLAAMRAWAAEEDGVPDDAYPAYSRACIALGWACVQETDALPRSIVARGDGVRALAEEVSRACAADRERADAAQQLAAQLLEQQDRVRVEAVARQIQAVAEVERLRAEVADITHADVTVGNVRRVLSGELTDPTPGTLAYEVAHALMVARFRAATMVRMRR